jgi:hypothetical protein
MADAAEVGRKAASLGELLAAGGRVPDGVVLMAEAAGMTASAASLHGAVRPDKANPVRSTTTRRASPVGCFARR